MIFHKHGSFLTGCHARFFRRQQANVESTVVGITEEFVSALKDQKGNGVRCKSFGTEKLPQSSFRYIFPGNHGARFVHMRRIQDNFDDDENRAPFFKSFLNISNGTISRRTYFALKGWHFSYIVSLLH